MRYHYKARNIAGIAMEGKMEAQSERDVVSKLSSLRLNPIVITPIYHEITVEVLLARWFGWGEPTKSDLIIFVEQMSTLTRSGVSLIEALHITCEASASEKLTQKLLEVIIQVESGYTLSQALAKHPQLFSPFFIALVSVGEETGEMGAVFKVVKEHLIAELETKRRIKTTLRYPMMVLCAIVGAVFIINIVVLPSFLKFFNTFEAILPLPTRILIYCSDIFVHYGFWLLSAGLLIIGGIFFALRTPTGQTWGSYCKFKIPIVKEILKKILMIRFCHTFAMALGAQVSLLPALKAVSQVVEEPYISKKILELRHHIEKGATLSQAINQTNWFPPMMVRMLMIGEETGDVVPVLNDIADYYERTLRYDLKQLNDFIEPLLLIIVALMVLVLALGIFLPLWDISTLSFNKMSD